MNSHSRRSPSLIQPGRYDPQFQEELERLHRLTVKGRWLLILGLWVTIGPICIWFMRTDIHLMSDYFTWASLRYALAFNPIMTIGLVLCVGSTASTLLWQSRNILLGLSDQDLKYLEKRLLRIRQQGKSHPLWRRVCDQCNTSLNHST